MGLLIGIWMPLRLVIVVLLLALLEGLSCLEMPQGPLSDEEHGRLDVPRGAEILLNAKTLCTVPPVELRAWLAVVCQMVHSGRSCMDAMDKKPIYVGHKCSGQECLMDLVPGPTSCMLQPFGVEIQAKNESRKATCGLDPQDSYWLGPFKNEEGIVENGINCVNGLPSDVAFTVWAPCVKGMPTQIARLQFTEPMPDDYSCMSNPTCDHGSFNSHLVCYKDKASTGESSGSNTIGLVMWGLSTLIGSLGLLWL